MGLTSHPVAIERQEEGKQIRDKDVQAIVYHLDPVKQHKKRVAKGVSISRKLSCNAPPSCRGKRLEGPHRGDASPN